MAGIPDMLRSKAKAPKPKTPPGKPGGAHDPEPQAPPVPPKTPGSFVPTFGRGRLGGVGTDPGLSALRPPGVTSRPPRPGGLPTGISGPPSTVPSGGPVPRYRQAYGKQVR